MNRIALVIAALTLTLAASAANAWSYSYTCTDGYTWVDMVYAQPIGSSCTVRMRGGWIYYGYTI